MKNLLLTSLLFISLASSAQTATAPAAPAENVTLLYKQYGYLEGVRLDSLPSKYIHVSVLGSAIRIDYGQEASLREQRVTDNKGKKINYDGFRTEGLGALFNFLDFNGWEYVDNYLESSYKYFIFKKKN